VNALEAAIAGIFNELDSHVQTLGYFDVVQMHEPKSALPNGPTGLACSMFLTGLAPYAIASGLAATSARIEMTARIHRSFLAVPENLIDINMAMATAATMSSLSGDFDLGGTIRNVDLLGAAGQPLSARAGYVTVDKTVYRIMDIVVPMIVNDAFTQAA